jgi:hypothetical protein
MYKFKDDITILFKNNHYDLLYYREIKNDSFLSNYIIQNYKYKSFDLRDHDIKLKLNKNKNKEH